MEEEKPEQTPEESTGGAFEGGDEQPAMGQPLPEQPDSAQPSAEVASEPGASEDVASAAESGESRVPQQEAAAGVEPAAEETPAIAPGSATADESTELPEQAAAPTIRGKVDRSGVAIGTGRRKTAVARVRITQGSGELSINGRPMPEHFRIERDRKYVEAPLRATQMSGKVDVWVRVEGGGTTGQAGAVVLGIARALEALDARLHEALSDGGYLTRDDRMVERKKYGYKKARKSFQFSKR